MPYHHFIKVEVGENGEPLFGILEVHTEDEHGNRLPPPDFARPLKRLRCPKCVEIWEDTEKKRNGLDRLLDDIDEIDKLIDVDAHRDERIECEEDD
jgi:hypothetical protein